MFANRFAAPVFGIFAVGVALALSACSTSPTQPVAESAAFTSAGDAAVVASFDLASGQLPENIVAAGDNVAVTFAASRQIAIVSPAGKVEVLGTLPAPTGGGAATPVLGFPLATGLADVDGSYYALYATGEADTTGLWKLDSDGEFELVAALPAAGLPNGLAFDSKNDRFLAADSVLGSIYSIDLDGDVVTWSDDEGLAQDGFLGANGVKLHDGDLFVSNLDAGTLLQIDIGDNGAAGDVTVVADDLAGIDDFAFTGRGDQVVATLDPTSEVVLVDNGESSVVLTADDGLTNPTSVLVKGDRIYIPSAAYVNQDNPNLVTATLM